MKEIGLINRDLEAVISSLGHMDELIVCDAGFPIP
ncbi:MAG: RbsD/FucU domain-containing protein, partial [Caldilineaceae bacterium]